MLYNLTKIFDKSLTTYIILQTNHWEVRIGHLYLYNLYYRLLKEIVSIYTRTNLIKEYFSFLRTLIFFLIHPDQIISK